MASLPAGSFEEPSAQESERTCRAFTPVRLPQRLQDPRVSSRGGIERSTEPRADSDSIPVETRIIENENGRLNSLGIGMKLQERRVLQ
jgi:hypothetical protein